MNNKFYFKLAISNIKSNSKTYIPYILTCIGSICMFYIMHAISGDPGLDTMSGSQSLKLLLRLGSIIVAIFSVIIIFYTNSFLIKRRKKELGLYNILGMEKRHIGRVMFFETIIVSIGCIISGILLGLLLEKLMFMVLLKILSFDVPLGFSISAKSVVTSIVLFICTFMVTLLNNLRQIHLTNPIELLRGGNIGEREPKVKWPLVVIGVTTLGAGYYIALTTDAPLKALLIFFFAVILVIIGTYSLFTAGSIAVLKVLKKNKKFYYQTKHFTSVSGMIYRMKQNAAGLASICILATAVLVTLSTTVSMFAGQDDIMRRRFGRDLYVGSPVIDEAAVSSMEKYVQDAADNHGIKIDNELKFSDITTAFIKNGSNFEGESGEVSTDNAAVMYFISLDEYNSMEGKDETLDEGQILLCSVNGEKLDKSINVLGTELQVKNFYNEIKAESLNSVAVFDSYYVIVKDMDTVKDIFKNYEVQQSYNYGFDMSGASDDEKLEFYEEISKEFESSYGANVECVIEARQSFFAVYGGLFFLGIFLGILFLLATVLIIYYKQVSEGYDDRRRFEIMQQVGMSKEEVKKTIHSQVLMVFFLPLAVAGVHIAFSFRVITKLLAVLNFTNIKLFALCTVITVLIFAVFYAVIYFLTAKTYYKIVNQKYEY